MRIELEIRVRAARFLDDLQLDLRVHPDRFLTDQGAPAAPHARCRSPGTLPRHNTKSQ